MKLDETESLSIEEKKVSEEIFRWCSGNENELNVISPPYNTTLIFMETILYFVRHEKRVLYITDEKHKSIQMIRSLRRYTNFKQYTYLKNNIDTANYYFILCSYNIAVQIEEKFDLVIYDEIRSYPKHSKIEIEYIMNNCRKNDGKLIAYSVDGSFSGDKELYLNIRSNKMPLVEPRLITTRMDVNKEMPFVVYEYIKWSMNINRRVIIPVPDKVKLFNVMSYVCKYCDALTRNIFYYSSEEKNIKTIIEYKKFNDSIMVTDDFDSVCVNDDSTNIIVFFADSEKFTYKELIYFCGRTGNGGIKTRGEVVFLANTETLDIEKAKNITRNFNKEAWKKGLLRL